jgi:transposase
MRTLHQADLAENPRRNAQGKQPAVISPLALEAVRRFDGLFEIERTINGQSTERRKAVRQELSEPVVADLESWMRERRARLSRGNDVASAQSTTASLGFRETQCWRPFNRILRQKR